jgi:hypothetical protein
MNSGLRARTNLLLAALVVLDVVLSGACLFFPDLWFKWFHAAPYVDPQGLLRRTGAVWAAFTLLQLMALVRWQRYPHWLVLVAGVRLTEIFSDWTYLFFCSNITWFGRAALFVSPLGNLAFAWILLRTWARVAKGDPGVGVTKAAGSS